MYQVVLFLGVLNILELSLTALAAISEGSLFQLSNLLLFFYPELLSAKADVISLLDAQEELTELHILCEFRVLRVRL